MPDWESGYSIDDRIEKKIGAAWLPGTVKSNTPGFGVGGILDNKAPFVAIEPNEIRHLQAAAKAGPAKPATGAGRPAAGKKKPKKP